MRLVASRKRMNGAAAPKMPVAAATAQTENSLGIPGSPPRITTRMKKTPAEATQATRSCRATSGSTGTVRTSLDETSPYVAAQMSPKTAKTIPRGLSVPPNASPPITSTTPPMETIINTAAVLLTRSPRNGSASREIKTGLSDETSATNAPLLKMMPMLPSVYAPHGSISPVVAARASPG